MIGVARRGLYVFGVLFALLACKALDKKEGTPAGR